MLLLPLWRWCRGICPLLVITFASGLVRADTGEPALRLLADRVNLRIGAAISPAHLDGDERYGAILAREFNALTPENAMKFRNLAREEGLYDFREADQVVTFAREHSMAVRGHTLVWHQQLPDWLTEERYTPDEIETILRQHIATVVARYREDVHAWDVVNEAFDDDGSLRDTIWLRTIGPGYIAKAFRWAHEADPEARLFYNDYSAEGMNPKSDAVYRMLGELVQEGVPVHGVGLQMHLVLGGGPAPDEIARNISRLSGLGLEVAVTEMDVRIPRPVTVEKLEEQAKVYGNILEIVLSEDAVNELTLWGFTDRHSWIPRWFPATDAGLIFDEEFAPKPAYHALRERLAAAEPAGEREEAVSAPGQQRREELEKALEQLRWAQENLKELVSDPMLQNAQEHLRRVGDLMQEFAGVVENETLPEAEAFIRRLGSSRLPERLREHLEQMARSAEEVARRSLASDTDGARIAAMEEALVALEAQVLRAVRLLREGREGSAARLVSGLREAVMGLVEEIETVEWENPARARALLPRLNSLYHPLDKADDAMVASAFGEALDLLEGLVGEAALADLPPRSPGAQAGSPEAFAADFARRQKHQLSVALRLLQEGRVPPAIRTLRGIARVVEQVRNLDGSPDLRLQRALLLEVVPVYQIVEQAIEAVEEEDPATAVALLEAFLQGGQGAEGRKDSGDPDPAGGEHSPETLAPGT
jgi:endo-1,4-beta-xylanase